MKKCSICGSQRRLHGDKDTKYRDIKKLTRETIQAEL